MAPWAERKSWPFMFVFLLLLEGSRYSQALSYHSRSMSPLFVFKKKKKGKFRCWMPRCSKDQNNVHALESLHCPGWQSFSLNWLQETPGYNYRFINPRDKRQKFLFQQMSQDFTKQILDDPGGGHQEDVTAGWLTSWTQALRGSSPPPVPGTYPLPTIPMVGDILKDDVLREWDMWLNPVKTST